MERSSQPAGAPGVCPFTVDRPVMTQRWERLTFLHWPFEPAAVQRLIPGSLRVETFGGAAWVGLVPFFMRVATPGGRRVPWASNFCETNVRTYVTDSGGRAGIWFLSLDAARLGAVTVARTTYRLPYFWSRMRLAGGGTPGGAVGSGEAAGGGVSYSCRRRWPGPRGAASRVRIRIGAPFAPGELGDRDHFLTARWILFSVHGTRARFARACHQPWPVHRARLLDLDDGLVAAAGLPRPEGEPLIHYSPGVDVRIGRPETYR
jgi:uncharacterized protein YqjF (DUF2071 family)